MSVCLSVRLSLEEFTTSSSSFFNFRQPLCICPILIPRIPCGGLWHAHIVPANFAAVRKVLIGLDREDCCGKSVGGIVGFFGCDISVGGNEGRYLLWMMQSPAGGGVGWLDAGEGYGLFD